MMAKYRATVVATQINSLPSLMKMVPRLPAMANKNAFLRIKKKASLQQVQKL
jgi:hypothetical protein